MVLIEYRQILFDLVWYRHRKINENISTYWWFWLKANTHMVKRETVWFWPFFINNFHSRKRLEMPKNHLWQSYLSPKAFTVYLWSILPDVVYTLCLHNLSIWLNLALMGQIYIEKLRKVYIKTQTRGVWKRRKHNVSWIYIYKNTRTQMLCEE